MPLKLSDLIRFDAPKGGQDEFSDWLGNQGFEGAGEMQGRVFYDKNTANRANPGASQGYVEIEPAEASYYGNAVQNIDGRLFVPQSVWSRTLQAMNPAGWGEKIAQMGPLIAAGALGGVAMSGYGALGAGELAGAGAGDLAAGGIAGDTLAAEAVGTGAFDMGGVGALGSADAVAAGMGGVTAPTAAGGWEGFLKDLASPRNLISLGGQVAGAVMGSNAAQDAADAQAAGSAASIGEQRRQYDITRDDNAIMRGSRDAAQTRLNALMGLDPAAAGTEGYGSLTRRFTMADRNKDPVYRSGLQFGLNEGRNAIDARAIAGGGYDSGATLKALTKFGNDYGTTKAEGAYNRFNADNAGIYNKLAGVSGAGQQAVNQVTTAGTNMANNVSNSYTDIGNSRAAGIVGGQNAWGSALEGFNTTMNNNENRRVLERLLQSNRR